MSPALKPRWFRFSLRTLFVMVTVLGCWSGYELNWIRQRNEYIAEKDAIWIRARDGVFAPGATPDHGMIDFSRGTVAAPSLLWLFGERGVGSLQVIVWVEDVADDDIILAAWRRERKQAMHLFPEAEGRIHLHWAQKPNSIDGSASNAPISN